MTVAAANRHAVVRHGRALEYFTVGYNSAEGVISLVAGLLAGSVSLIGFGLDSIIEVISGVALLWRLHHDWNESRREAVEKITLQIVGWCLVTLALYVACDSGWSLLQHEKPERSIIQPRWASPITALTRASTKEPGASFVARDNFQNW